MKIGDKVIMSEIGMCRYDGNPDNPSYTLGVIDSNCKYLEFEFRVIWSNGESNIYYPDDLQVIQC